MFSEDEYRLEFFKSEGFHRRKCESCGKYFWTRDQARRSCGDPPCDPYTFIGSPVFSLEYNLDQMRELYLRFFEERGHTRIKRYPVIARWRDDIYLTIASIADFQPFVTGGLVPPPANPLTISQPCIRLDDLDSVGRSGRHLTTFEMMAHHVFNTREHEIYWKDRTVALCDELLLKLGADPMAVTYKESPWAGGGNAGPSVEVLVGGLELATLVFMDLRATQGGMITIKGESYSKMNNYIVDTGYGLERFVWSSKGTPTIYDALFPDMIRLLTDAAGIEHDLTDPEYAKIFAENAKLAGMVDLESCSMQDIRKKIASSIGTTPKRLNEVMEPMERIYAVVDHTRCLAYMLGDGIIPSNVKAGYLARLVLRRTLRRMHELGLKMPLSELVIQQLMLLDYPNWNSKVLPISEILELEEERYADTLEKGTRLVKKIALHYSTAGKPIPLNEMISLYDTHGIAPEIAKEAAASILVEAELPDNFYSIVASTHIKAAPEEKTSETLTEEFGKTRLLFYEQPFEGRFEASVSGIIDGSVILDVTLFYPEGGGQPADHGMLEKGRHVLKVVDVRKVGDTVYHVVEDPASLACIAVGDRIIGHIDMSRRLAHARHHTATHLVHDSAKEVLGKHIWQAGAQKSEEGARLDVSHYKRITRQELLEIEIAANRRVMECTPVDTRFLPREEAERLFGFELYQGGVPPGKQIRVVKVGGDIEACAGTHVTNTGMIGMIRLLRSERIQDGVERIEFSAGEAAVRRSQERENLLFSSADTLRVPIEQMPKTTARFFEEWKSQQKEIERLKEELARSKISSLAKSAIDVGGVMVVASDLGSADVEELVKAASMLAEMDLVAILGCRGNGARIVAAAGKSAISRGVKAGGIVKSSAPHIGGKGGGRPELAQGGGTKEDGMAQALQAGIEAVKEMITV